MHFSATNYSNIWKFLPDSEITFYINGKIVNALDIGNGQLL